MRVLLTISYDGTQYCGWQRQNGQITIQQTIEEAISRIYDTDVKILGASRTDSGVHALEQRASFCPPDTRVDLGKIFMAINSFLPEDIRVLSSEAVEDCFHVINDVKSKTYKYVIQNKPVYDPVLFRFSHHVKEPLNLELMTEAAKHFVGKHDFKAFCAAHSGAVTTCRTVQSLCVSEKNGVISFVISGNGFLYNMVRIIAGTLVAVGNGKIVPNYIPYIILGGVREKAGATLPAKGLTLLRIEY